MDDLDNIIHLTDENGFDCDFEFLDLIEFKGDEYVILLPCSDTEDEAGEVVILLVDASDDDSETYVSVDDEEILNSVFQLFKEKFKEEFSFLED